MDAITGYMSAHPVVLVICVVLVVILFLQFTFKSLLKLILIMVFILLVAFGYYYFKDPSSVPEKVKTSVEAVEAGINGLSDKGKGFYKDSKELYKKGKEAPKDINNLLKNSEKELDKK